MVFITETNAEKTVLIQSKSSINVWKIAIIAFSSGAIVMALEIAGSRLLTPVFGSSTYTWGILIGIILSGLTIGYHIGGRISDSDPNFQKLCSVVFSTGLFILFVPFISQNVIGFFVNTISDPLVANLLSTIILFGLPTLLLGFVSPYTIKLCAKSLLNIGKVSGNLYSVATMGSIFGTFLTVFVLIPFFEINDLILGLGITLIVISILGLNKIPAVLAGILAILVIFGIGDITLVYPSEGNKILVAKDTQYSNLVVLEDSGFRTMYLNGVIQSRMELENPNELVVSYTETFHLAGLIDKQLDNVLFVGGGGFSGPKSFLVEYPDAKIDVVEIDSDVIEAAKKFFYVPNDPRLNIINQDARLYLSQTEKKYDAVILDAYSGSSIPYHLLTLEYYEILEEKTHDDGVIISNLVAPLDPSRSILLESTYITINQVFDNVYIFPENVLTDHRQNISILVTKNNIDIHELLDSTECSDHILNCDSIVKNYFDIKPTKNAVVLTDQKSPVNILAEPKEKTDFYENIQARQNAYAFLTTNYVVVGLIAITAIWSYNLHKIWQKQTKLKTHV